jgi:hypothetical protein
MSRKQNYICAILMLGFIGISPVAAVAAPLDVSNMDAAALRAMFHGPAFASVCPLDVYDEDYSSTTAARRAVLAPEQQHTVKPSRSAAAIIQEMLRGSDIGSPDGLDDYGETFTSAKL